MLKFVMLVSLLGLCLGKDVPRSTRIMGGYEVAIEDAPFMAVVKKIESYLCPAVIVSSTQVVTSADCISRLDTGMNWNEVVTATDIDGAFGASHSIKKPEPHDLYDGVTHDYDIGILTLWTEIELSELARPIQLAETEPEAGTVGTVYGWGDQEYNPSLKIRGQLRAADMSMVDSSSCNESYAYELRSQMMCAGGEGGVDRCPGDEGGPFVVNGKLAGVATYVTWAYRCGLAGYPTTYTSVAKLRDWLLDRIDVNSTNISVDG